MGWFDEQLKQRIKNDKTAFSDAFASLADTVMDVKLSQILNSNQFRTKYVIDEILNYYKIKPIDIPDTVETIEDQLEYVMHPVGIMRRNVKLSGRWYEEAFGPILATRRDNNLPVALIPGKFSGYVFIDSETGKTFKVTKKNEGLFSKEAICFYEPLPEGSLSKKDLWKYMIGTVSGYHIFELFTSVLLTVLLGLLIPKLNNFIYSNVIVGKDYVLLVSVFFVLISVSISQLLIHVISRVLSAGIGNKMSTAIHTAIMMRLISLPASFFKKQSSGELASSVINIGTYISIMVKSILTLGISSLFALFYIGAMVSYGGIMAFWAALVILAGVIFSLVSTIVEINTMNKIVAETAKEEGLTYALVSGIQKIRLAGAEKRAFAKWAGVYKNVSQYKNNIPLIVKLREPVSECIPLIGMLVTYFYGIKTNVSVSDFFAFQSAFGLVAGAFLGFSEMFRLFSMAKPAISMVLPIMNETPEIEKTKKIVSRLTGGFEINHLYFKYQEDSPYVLEDLSLKVTPGQYVAIVGESGSGKSTLMRLLLGFEKSTRGAIYFDGKDIKSLDLKSLRRNIGSVMQNERLFAGDIYSNITISAPWLSIEEAFQAAKIAGIDEDIKQMPMGMNTIVSEGGGGISGGQRQRIIIARAVASQPKILMFDEATSALDNITQKTVSDSLGSMKCTRIVIAHRLSTIKNCDRIIVLDKGKIVEDGSYDELINQNGFFAELVKRQQINC